MGKIAPSILSADFTRLGEEVKAVEEAGADLIHVDIMDGHFVPNITAGPLVVKAVRKVTKLPLDVHLMISAPDEFITSFVDAGADMITIHVEAVNHLHRSLQYIMKAGVKPGVSLNPATPLEMIQYVLEDLNMVLVMTVNPGFEAQEFIPQVVPKIKALRKMVDERGLEVDIEVDGGINPETIAIVSSAGANVFVAGSAIFYSNDYRETIRLMRERITPYLWEKGSERPGA
ncbi:MAG: ribulose-phosphate 3-epimerase [Deltaproteobacteria bacterium]|nr:ribulose-phosphate 3-epimerase [Deltaproteobacteria bacterium]MBW2043492.1 ribulose-phosphate 3-epimerase [Deltaproteobacteria bacterium]MBW2299671.1 ribulose-phosphate 3-epimerase [Deltaproteobacteria bacterium]